LITRAKLDFPDKPYWKAGRLKKPRHRIAAARVPPTGEETAIAEIVVRQEISNF